jgi:hypothetical protein
MTSGDGLQVSRGTAAGVHVPQWLLQRARVQQPREVTVETEPDRKRPSYSNQYSNSGCRIGLQGTKRGSEPAGQAACSPDRKELVDKRSGVQVPMAPLRLHFRSGPVTNLWLPALTAFFVANLLFHGRSGPFSARSEHVA